MDELTMNPTVGLRCRAVGALGVRRTWRSALPTVGSRAVGTVARLWELPMETDFVAWKNRVESAAPSGGEPKVLLRDSVQTTIINRR